MKFQKWQMNQRNRIAAPILDIFQAKNVKINGERDGDSQVVLLGYTMIADKEQELYQIFL